MQTILNNLVLKFKKKITQFRFKKILKNLTSNSIAIDCGANIGFVTTKIAKTGAKVYAFEPNKDAYDQLKYNCRNFNNVILYKQAVGIKEDEVKLFHHVSYKDDPIKWSTGSSLLDYKANVNDSTFEFVSTIDLTNFMINLNNSIDIVKIDIEGMEIDVVNKIIDLNLYKKVNYFFVEIHDDKIPELKMSTNLLKKRIKDLGIKNINLYWQ
jgi:FkbM family methyltransferase